MATQRTGGLTLDACTRCEGLWFDRGELEAFARSATAERVAAQVGTGAPRPTNGEPLPCPRCTRQTLRSYRLENIVLSRCTDCGGVYLDGDDVRALRGRRPVYQRATDTPPRRGAAAAAVTGGISLEFAVEAAVELALRAAITAITPF